MMNKIRISDVTMKQTGPEISLSFREKIEMSKLLDKLGVDIIELEPIAQTKIDSLRIKSVAAAVRDAVVAVPVALNAESVSTTWNALREAKKARLQVPAAVSPVQMEYLFHKKPDAMLAAIRETIEKCCALCPDVEFIADDATRADPAFLQEAVRTAISAGAKTITVCDTAGAMLPNEFTAFIRELYAGVPELKDVTLGISCSDQLSMADSCAFAAIRYGAGEIKAAAYRLDNVSLPNVARVLSAKGEYYNAACTVRTTSMKRITERIAWMCRTGRSETSPFDNGVREDSELYLTAHDDLTAVLKVAASLGYDLNEEDGASVFAAFKEIAAKREKVTARELDAIVASAAMQVPPAYTLDSFVVTAGNTISATANIRLIRDGKALAGVSLGDGPIDAAFLAIEQITGHHYELDDFQIQSVTEGREAMGQTIVKLRSSGKVYSGRGISTDIVGSGILAYINALNKIVYEEETV